MIAKRFRTILSAFLIISILAGYIPAPSQSRVFANESNSNSDSDPMSIEAMMERFNTTKSFIQEMLDEGYSLNQIYAGFVMSKINQVSFEQALDGLFPKEQNNSQTASSDVKDSLGDGVTLSTSSPSKGLKSGQKATADEPKLEKPPEYSKAAMNQAPYSIGSQKEQVSSLTGSLSTSDTDFTLPGRNGLSFALNRKYDSNAAQFYDMNYGSNAYYNYLVKFNASLRKLIPIYLANYHEVVGVQEDYNNDGIVDNELNVIISRTEKTSGIYATFAEADQNKDYYYTTGSDSKTVTDSRTSSTNSFVSSIAYSQNGYSGTLYPSGSSFVKSGSEGGSRTETKTCTHDIKGTYDTNGVWKATYDSGDCPASYPYSSGGYTGTLTKTTTDIISTCNSSGRPYSECTKSWRANYSGTVTKADDRLWQQNYQGTVTKPGIKSKVTYGNWTSYGDGTSKRWRYTYTIENCRVAIASSEGPADVAEVTAQFPNYADAVEYKNSLLLKAKDTYLGLNLDSNNNAYNVYAVTNPNPTISSVQVGASYFNTTETSTEEKLFPLGKGWSWDLPYIESKDGNQNVHLMGGGSYKVNGTKLENYEWEGLSFVTDTSVTVNGEASKYALVPINGTWKQYFTSDGRLLQISDAYNNAVQFSYAQNAAYGRKLLSQVKDAIGNTINITYSATEVVVTKGTQTVKYAKRMEQGVELLDSVIDAAGRKTTYSYELKGAKFNLMAEYPSRAISNPYALLKKVVHPTGASTEYEFEPLPVQRYIGASSVNQAYRLFSRKDVIYYSNGSSSDNNLQTFNYGDVDFGSSYDQNLTIQPTVSNVLTDTKFTYKKNYIDANTPAQYYLEKSETTADNTVKTTAYAYTKKVGSRTYPVTSPTSVTTSDNLTTDILTSSQQFDDYGNVVQSTDAKGNPTVNTFDPTKYLLQSTSTKVDASTTVYSAFTRNAQGTITQAIVRKTNATGELLQQTDLGNIDTYGNIKSVTVKNGTKNIVATLDYDSAYSYAFPTSQSVNVTNIDGQTKTITTTAEYDNKTGLTTAWVDGKGNRTAYEFDALNRINKVTNPGGSLFIVQYDDVLNTITGTNEVGNKSKITWNALGMKVEEGLFESAGYRKKAKYGYNSYGQMTSSEDAKGNQSQYAYDKWGRQTTTTYPDGSQSVVTYNDATRSVTKADAEGYAQVESYDKFGQLTKVEERATATSALTPVSKFVYDPISGKTLESIDAMNYVTRFGYDTLGRITSVENALHEMTRYGYDMVGNLTSTTYHDGNVKTKSYDELGRVIGTKNEANLIEKNYYDANSNLVSNVDRNSSTTTYTYDNRNRLTARTSPQTSVTYAYDNAGKRTGMTDGTGTTSFDYDPYTGQLLQMVYPDTLKLTYEYDENGNRKTMTGPFGQTTYYAYDNLNQIESVGTTQNISDASYSYLRNGLLSETNLKNGTSMRQQFTGLQLSSLDHLVNQVSTTQYQYDYDANKNITSRTKNGNLDSFAYDSLNRTATSSEFAETYQYDERGNRLTMESDWFNLPVAMENTFDDLNRLTQVKIEDGESAQYRYNGDGLMVERTQGGETRRYYYDGDQIIAEAKIVNGAPQLVANYVRGNGLAVIAYANGTKAYPLYNGHGDLVELRDEAGNVLNRYTYDIWGNITSKEEQVYNPFRYSGEYWDDTTNLQYLRARWYDPSIGRFISEDTYEGQIDNPLSLNLYTYVKNNPLTYNDPSGHEEAKVTVYAAACSDSGGHSCSLTQKQMESNALYIYNYFTDKGWSKEAISAVLGNMQQESGLNPGQWQNWHETGKGDGYGLVQWTPAGEKFLKWANLTPEAADKLAKNDPKKLMDNQLEFLQMNMNLIASKGYGGEWIPTKKYGSPYKMKAKEFIKSTESVADLTKVFHGSFERSADSSKIIQKRVSYAQKWYKFLSAY